MNVVGALSEQFRQLNINNSLVPGDGVIIPFQDSFDPTKKHHPQPEVDLDDDIDRARRLLMLDVNSHVQIFVHYKAERLKNCGDDSGTESDDFDWNSRRDHRSFNITRYRYSKIPTVL
ncbi:hypothetical protein RJT34_17286 [Clitoria ternatea]|uniref:Uncharacterized protein n=1 Tax=Clitoria ternatea TaxID=43366 RepID=A0AAN9J904_CLITE